MDDNSKYQNSIPHTFRHQVEALGRIMDRGLDEVEVARFKRVFGDGVFKKPCSCPKCRKAI